MVILTVWLWFHCYVSLCYCLEWYYKHIDFGAAKFSHASLSGYPFRCICFLAKNVVFWNYAISSLFPFDFSFFYIIVWIFYFIRRISNFSISVFVSLLLFWFYTFFYSKLWSLVSCYIWSILFSVYFLDYHFNFCSFLFLFIFIYFYCNIFLLDLAFSYLSFFSK